MAETTTSPATTSGGGSPLLSERGKTSIADSVVAKIAGIATREIAGIHNMGTGTARAMGVIRDKLPGSGPARGVTQGVGVEVGERQAAIDLALVVEYGVSIIDLTTAVRRNVLTSVERMTGLEVTEVNITVDDVHLPTDDDDDEADASEPSRVR